MKAPARPQSERRRGGPIAAPETEGPRSGDAEFVDNRAEAAARRRLSDAIGGSARQATQRQAVEATDGSPRVADRGPHTDAESGPSAPVQAKGGPSPRGDDDSGGRRTDTAGGSRDLEVADDSGEERPYFPIGDESESEEERPFFPIGDESESEEERPYFAIGDESESEEERPYLGIGDQSESEEEEEDWQVDARLLRARSLIEQLAENPDHAFYILADIAGLVLGRDAASSDIVFEMAALCQQLGQRSAAARRFKHLVKWDTDAAVRSEAAARLRDVGGSFSEQGDGGDPELAEEQARARTLAALAGEEDRLPTAEQQGDSGWALLGMSRHGVEFDERQAAEMAVENPDREGALVYSDDAQRAGQMLVLQGDRFVRPDGSYVTSELTVENVGERMPRGLIQGKQRRFAAELLAKGHEAEAKEVLAFDVFAGDSGRWRELLAMVGSREAREEMVTEVKQELVDSGALIYVMNRSGQFFAQTAELYRIHHSSFLAGGAVAAAGDVVLSGGRIRRISNNSGHYMPGPAYLWQAVRQLQSMGVDPATFEVEVLGAGTLTASEFLENFSPLLPVDAEGHLSFSPAEAVEAVRDFLGRPAAGGGGEGDDER